MTQRARREYLQLLDASKFAAEAAIESFNAVRRPYRYETTLLLFANAWELLAKAVLRHRKQAITKGQRGETISAEVAIHRLVHAQLLTQQRAEVVQQIISLRNAACHHILPVPPIEIMQHLLFYGTKFFRELIKAQFKQHAKTLQEHYLSMSFSDQTTYADKIQKCVSRVKKSGTDKKLVWLLERGVQFDGEAYITEAQFSAQYKGRKRIFPHLKLSDFVRSNDMVRIVPIEAPRNFTADINLRKGNAADSSLPVVVKKTDLEGDYPYLTGEVAVRIGKNTKWVAKAFDVLKLKGDSRYHTQIRAGQSTQIQRYSDAALNALRERLAVDATFNPYATAVA